MTYVVVETYRPGKTGEIYNRLRQKGRLMPEGVEYVSSWVTYDHLKCYQIVRARNRELLNQWIGQWNDLVDFEVHAVLTSEEASREITG